MQASTPTPSKYATLLAMTNHQDIVALAQARGAIESAIAVLKVHRGSMTEGQLKELKRLIYDAPED